ncbi:MAG: DEAD/DEAH box helicase, partial [Fuerstiella sp.]
MSTVANQSALDTFHPCTRDWFLQAFQEPTGVQAQAWPEIAAGNSTLLLAPTGSGKTLAAFLAAIDRLFFDGQSAATAERLAAEAKTKAKRSRAIPKVSLGVRVLYISPLKALGVDVDRNLRGPLAGLRAYAEKHEVKHWLPRVAVRSGDTSQKERASIVKNPPDILITTPESLYLMLTSKSDAIIKTVDTIIIDEIHALAGTKRGAHLMTTLERLERLRVTADDGSDRDGSDDDRHGSQLAKLDVRNGENRTSDDREGDVRKRDRKPLQRIGLSATQRPLEEIATLLGGGNATADPAVPVKARPVTIVDASERRRFDLTIETPAEDRENDLATSVNPFADDRAVKGGVVDGVAVDDGGADGHHGSPYDDPMYQPGDEDIPIGSASSAPMIPSVWPSIHPRLVELVKANRSTMIFVNSRRLAERLATAINEEANEEIALAHHGSIAKDIRSEIEDRLKRGDLPAMVATSSMELGIDMGAVDLVIQIEAPPSIASATQRIGRAGHQVGAISTGIIFPKYKGDLVACTAATGAMLEGWVEETYYPRNPLDILAQQIVAVASRESIHIDELYATMRSAAPFFELPHSSFISVLDLLSGRYPSDEFSELRPRVNWDRITGLVSPRKGAQRLAILNAGTIPDRGLYGVFLVGENGESGGRVGELDEEMVFECRPGDVFLLGASSWRVMDITRDRVEVVPAPGEPGRMPFWRGDGPGRPLEFGKAIGKLSRELVSMPVAKATTLLTSEHGLQESAAESLLGYLEDQKAATVELPTDQCIVIESFLDEVGDWRIVILSPYGSRVHAPWAMLVSSRMRKDLDTEVDVMWTDDGIVLRIPETHDVPDAEAFFPEPDEVEDELVREIGGTALFAAKFRENAARSLLLPRRNPAKRTPLWLQRKRSADLLKVASRFHNFPMLMETYRECLRDVFDMPGFVSLLKDVKSRAIRIHQVRSEYPSPYAGAVLFNYVGNFIYDGDAPLAERRAQTLALDHAQLRELLGTVDLREMFDADILKQLSLELQKLTDWKLRHADDLHGLLLDLGSLTATEIH